MKQNLKVIQIIDSLNPGGAEMMAVNIANGLSKKNVKSFLCTTRTEGLLKEKIKNTKNYLFLNRKNTLDIRAFKTLLHFIKKEKITIIHAHSSSIFIGFIMKLFLPKLTLVWHDHYGKSEALKKRPYLLLRFIGRKINIAIVVNELLFQWSKNILKLKSVINLPNFASLSENKIDSFQLKGVEGKRIICLANFRPQKDHLNLLKAFKIINKKYNDWTLHLVGLDLNDEYSKNVHQYIKENNLDSVVHCYGSIQNIANVLSQATIGVLASESEGLPVTLLEYGLVKLPVVVTDVGDCSKVVEHTKTGFVVPSKNATKLALKINKLIEDNALINIFGENLYKVVQENYSEDAYLEKLIAVYLK
ncbi:glycosyltransferase [Lutibacter sp. TH_r2]|uniref:glycosyltransferase n=1 Tax=Lutibacter sp. TH_r2 TaxID=3082083 RepID=UPI002952CC40|nr:glycosyltransferase [Lutibacter sp. TH_r2]MDV7187457.1 glycosyltransferase [Lutibacter sp. TH_r2]